MQSLSTLVSIDKKAGHPVYLQIANQLMALIKEGILPAGHRLLSTREMAGALQVHRKTVVQAYDELLVQGWLESQTGSGTFVARHLPEMHPQSLREDRRGAAGGLSGIEGEGAAGASGLMRGVDPLRKAGFAFQSRPYLDRAVVKPQARYHLDDGFPDARLAPLQELSRAYRSQLLTGNPYMRLGYGDTKGASRLRQELSIYLNETRGLKTSPENILVVRGTTMGVFLVSMAFLQPGDHVVVPESNWGGANMNFLQAGANLLTVPADNHGIDVDAIEKICRKKKVRLVYVTSHHHYPTTVALRADRRIQLLRLAEQYGFIIFEDDYDYDFHYLSKPLLPLASADRAGMVLYCGSFTKTISPAFRVGYLVASADVIAHLGQLRRIVDRQGDMMLENAMAELLQQGIIQRYMRKSLRLYRQRRDVFCALLKEQLGDHVEFQAPDGGMAVWTGFDPAIDLVDLSKRALQRDLYFYDGLAYQPSLGKLNATRLGFASSTPEELERGVEILKAAIFFT